VSAPLDGPLYFGVRIYYEPPKSYRGPIPGFCYVLPDLDKLIRGIWDPLHRKKAGLVHDDARIARILYAEKLYDHNGPRAEVIVGKLWTSP